MSDGRLWGGRFADESAEAFHRLNASLAVDRRLWPQDVAASRAHARMLGEQGIISADDARQIDGGLQRIAAELEAGDFAFLPGDEDIHTAVERRLTELVGDSGRRLHTARSRNDQIVTDTLMYLRERAALQAGMLRELGEVLLRGAEAHLDTLLPGYTHGQRAQPVRLAHHLLAYVWMLGRDRRRLANVVSACEECPLGSGALAGVGFPVDRHAVAHELGFARPSANSIDAVSSRDALLDYLSFAAQLGVHLSRLGAEVVIWAGDETRFVTLDDAYASGSSMLPHKKNPDAAELARAKAPRLAADLGGLLGVLAGLPLAYNKDLQEDKVFLFDAVDTVELLLPAVAGTMATLQFRVAEMAAAAGEGALAAIDLADHLVREGWPFRRAHEAVGALVRACEERGISLADAGPSELGAAGLGDVSVPQLSAEGSVEAKAVPGGTARAQVLDQLEAARALVASW